jgi:hypothetical protein
MSAEDWIILRLAFDDRRPPTADQIKARLFMLQKYGYIQVLRCIDQLWEERKAYANM